jgi:hypothetical protein
MRYLLSIQQPDGDPPPPAALAKVMREVGRVVDDARSGGVLVLTGGLDPARDAVVVRTTGRSVHVTDGPYAEAKEHVGGVFVLEVADRDAALSWARRIARAIGLPVEVRAFRGAAG